MTKVVTVLGTRPEIIRLSRVVPLLDGACRHVLVHTGQNFDARLSDLFFEELGVRRPDHHLGVRGASPADQIGQILTGCERVFEAEKPDRLLILGDTNSALCAIVAKRMGIPVFHMEAGNRCYDDRVPEEVNRRLIDHSSDVLMPYTERSRDNLLREGIAAQRVYVTGNPINEVMRHYAPRIEASRALAERGLAPRGYILVTLHRAENVDLPDRLARLAAGIDAAAARLDLPAIVSAHPRLQNKLAQAGVRLGPRVRAEAPFGFFDFLALEKNARLVLTDSGTVQEECAILGVPNLTLRDVTERPETVECGSNMLVAAEPDAIATAAALATAPGRAWFAPPEYLVENVAGTVVNIVLGYHRFGTR